MVFQQFECPRLASLGLAAFVTHAAASLRAQLQYISCLLRPGHLIATYSLDRGARHPGNDGVPVHKKGILTLNLFGNLRYALRRFRLSPLFTATTVFTLALCIGGTTAIFSLMHAVMLSSLPVADPPAFSASVRATTAVWRAACRAIGACTRFLCMSV